MHELLDLPYVLPANEAQMLDITLPDNDGFDTVLWFHGGGIENGHRRGDETPIGLVKKGYAVATADYRMYPNAKFPEFIEDAAAAVAFTLKRAHELGGNGRLFVGGSSAGAYLTMMLCMNPSFLKNVGVMPEDIAGFISDASQMFTHFNVLREMGMDTRLQYIDDKAPMHYINADLKLRPLLLIYYTRDIPCRPEENELFYVSVKRFLPDADITKVQLEGEHCSGKEHEPDGESRTEKLIEAFTKAH
ncbi:MAG: alpha/beta hydrolase [Clostridia bacterium]|nr:alpha/beta hydrolase [Clostridia bacterium]